MEIIPGILEKDWDGIAEKLSLVRPFAKTVHIDLIDGRFVDNLTHLDPEAFAPLADDFFLELHMMVEEPIEYVARWAKAGFRRFLGHIEQMSDQAAFVAEAERFGEVGLALDGPTPVSRIEVPLVDLDALLIYTSWQTTMHARLISAPTHPCISPGILSLSKPELQITNVTTGLSGTRIILS